MDRAKVKLKAVSTAAIASVLFSAPAVFAQENERLKDIVDEVNTANQVAQASQQRIDSIADETSKIFGEFKAALKTNAGLRAYNAQQRKVIQNQLEEIAKINESIGQIDEIKRQITPVMLEMIDNLQEFVEQDVPFQMEERLARIDTLRNVMDDPNVNDPERFRLVLEAYSAEVQYGRTINAYEGTNESERTVNFVRVGRVGFYYQSSDQSETAAWDNRTKSWVQLGDEYRTPVRQMIRIANRQVQSDVTTLPVLVPEGK